MANEPNIGSNPPLDEENKDLRKEAQGLWQQIKIFVSELLNIKNDTDRDSTIEAVKKDIPFKGHNAWILIFSIFVASIGLNVSSTAVVIGAMLISPLMGPIVGIGLSVAINDIDTLRRSLVNLGVMIFLSVITAFIYFKISPITEATPELLARTYPTILDVLVALFGGLALIVAKTKKGTIASVIFGVAIATALMPPLCTVGYGLAIGNWSYASGAMYLFSINAVFIALSTFLVSKLLGFPLVKYANQKRRKRIAFIASLIAIIVMVPSVYLFINLLRIQVFDTKTNDFVTNVIKYEGTEVVKSTQDFKSKDINVYLIGQPVPSSKINSWIAELKKDEALKDANLKIHQGSDQSSDLAEQLSSSVKAGILEDLYLKNQEALQSKDARILLLEDQLSKLKGAGIPFEGLSRETKINYPNIQRFSFSNELVSTFSATDSINTTLDTIPTFSVKWVDSIPQQTIIKDQKRLRAWLYEKFDMDTIAINRIQ